MRVDLGPSVRFSKLAWQKMWALVHGCSIEISWFGYCKSEAEKLEMGITDDFYIDDVYVVDQECTGVKSDMLPDAVSKLCIKLLDEGKDPSRLKLWGHSHVNMSVGFSGTDEDTIERLELEPLLSIVLNKKGEVNLRCDTFKNEDLGTWRHSYDCTYSVDDIQLIPDDWAKDLIKTHVKKPKPPKYVHRFGTAKKSKKSSSTKTQTYYGNWGGYWDDLDVPATKVSDSVESTQDLLVDGVKDALEFASYEIDLPADLDFLEEMFVKGDININELMESYAHYHLNNRSAEAVMDFLYEEDPSKSAEQQIEIEFIPEDEDMGEDEREEGPEYEDSMADPFYVNDNPSSLKINGSKLSIAEAK